MAIRCGRGPHTHETAAEVRRCYNGDPDVVSTPLLVQDEQPATVKQEEFVLRLAADRLEGDALKQVEDAIAERRWGRRSISGQISHLKTLPLLKGEWVPPGEDGSTTLGGYHKRSGPETTGDGQTATPLESGMYRLGEDVYKVQLAVHGSGLPYAKRLTKQGQCRKCDFPEYRHSEESEHEFSPKWKFEWEKGAVKRLRPEHRMTLEEAKAFGKIYGTCCVCGRTLTNETSIEEGIGPVCGGRV